MGFFNSLVNVAEYIKDEVKMAAYANSGKKPTSIVSNKSKRDDVVSNITNVTNKQPVKKVDNNSQVAVDKAKQASQYILNIEQIKRDNLQKYSDKDKEVDGVTYEFISEYYYIVDGEVDIKHILPDVGDNVNEYLSIMKSFISSKSGLSDEFFGLSNSDVSKFFIIIKGLIDAGIDVRKLRFNNERNLFNDLFEQLVKKPDVLIKLKKSIEVVA